MEQIRRFFASAAFGAIVTGLTGCAAHALNPSNRAATDQGQVPILRVQNCAVIQTGTPSRFACNGKVYTSFQLAKLREDEAKRYATGK